MKKINSAEILQKSLDDIPRISQSLTIMSTASVKTIGDQSQLSGSTSNASQNETNKVSSRNWAKPLAVTNAVLAVVCGAVAVATSPFFVGMGIMATITAAIPLLANPFTWMIGAGAAAAATVLAIIFAVISKYSTPKANAPETVNANAPETPKADAPETVNADVPETPKADAPDAAKAAAATTFDWKSEFTRAHHLIGIMFIVMDPLLGLVNGTKFDTVAGQRKFNWQFSAACSLMNEAEKYLAEGRINDVINAMAPQDNAATA